MSPKSKAKPPTVAIKARKRPPRPGEGGQPKLTEEVLLVMVNQVRIGNYYETAAAKAGVHRDTMRAWLKRGRREPRSIYGRFRAEMLKAEAEAESRGIGQIARAAMRDWKASAWFLQRRFPERWGRREQPEQLRPDLSSVSDKELMRELLRANPDLGLDDE